MLNRHRAEAAVDADDATGDERRRAAGRKIQRRANQFGRRSEAVHRCVPHDGGNAILGEQFAILFCRKEARLKGVHAHAMRSEFLGQEFGDLIYAAFGH